MDEFSWFWNLVELAEWWFEDYWLFPKSPVSLVCDGILHKMCLDDVMC